MPGLDSDDVKETGIEQADFIVGEDPMLDALIEGFDKKGKGAFADVLRAVRRAYRVKSTDLVGNMKMVGARVTFVDVDGEPHRALVMEPHVEEIQNADSLYDPRKDEYVDPSEYPTGTVQLIHGDGGEFGADGFFFDRSDDIAVVTSVPPAREPDDTYCYHAGWGYYENLTD